MKRGSSKCPLNLSDPGEVYNFFLSTIKEHIRSWEYFVDWQKVFKNIEELEAALNLLNCVVGKEDPTKSLRKLISEYPVVVKALPILLAVRETKFSVLIDKNTFKYEEFDFSKKELTRKDIQKICEAFEDSGLAELFRRKIKSVPDYVLGVEVGLDSNARKNRGGKLMESICEFFIKSLSGEMGFSFLKQAKVSDIERNFGIIIDSGEVDRTVDFAIFYNHRLFLIEVNFYSTSGSKLKATAGEYREMAKFWRSQGAEFVWITDGKGWLDSKSAIKEYIDDGFYLLNLEMLKRGCLAEILNRGGV